MPPTSPHPGPPSSLPDPGTQRARRRGSGRARAPAAPRSGHGRRARRPEQKEERRRQIKDAARALLDEGVAAGALNVGTLMARAGLAKGTGYLYYPTREALLLDVLAEELEGWFDTLATTLPDLGVRTPEALARALTEPLVDRPRLLALLAGLHAGLEANVDEAAAHAFRAFLSRRLTTLDADLRPCFPGFTEGDVARLLLRVHALVVGLAGLAHPSPPVAAALADPALAWLRVDLAAELEGALAAWLRGWGPAARPGVPSTDRAVPTARGRFRL